MVLFLKSKGEFILVGDLIRSMSLLKYNPTNSTLETVSRDFNSNYMRAVEIIDGKEDFFLGFDDYGNVFSARYNADAVSEEEKSKLEICGEFHIGDEVNSAQRGSLVYQSIEQQEGSHQNGSHGDSIYSLFSNDYHCVTGISNQASNVLFGTVSGAIGNIIALSEDSFRFFYAIEKAMKNFVTPVGGFNISEWRSFENNMRSSHSKNFIDGDLVEMILFLEPKDLETVCRDINEELTLYLNKKQLKENELPGNLDQPALGELISKLDAQSFQMSVEEIIRRVEDIARLH